MMISEMKNAEKFIEEINKNADAQVAAVKRETETYVNAELRKAKRLALQEINATQFSELDKLNEKNNTSFSESEKEETKALLQRRREITDAVFAEAEKRIVAFADSEQYADFLTASAKKLAMLVGGVFYLRPADEKYAPCLRPFCDEVRFDASICLGGVKAENADKRIAADDTLDARLAEERQAFYEKSGLSVTL